MPQYEYALQPAPNRAEKHRALKTNAEKFGQTLADVMNDMARDGWEFLRSETLPAEERAGLTSKTTVMHTFLVFRREMPLNLPQSARVIEADGDTQPRREPFFSASAREGSAPRLGPAE
jgi:hypothetical protein